MIFGSARDRDGGDADELAIGREGGLVDGRRIDADRGALAEEIFNQTVERLVGSIADIVVVAAEEGNAKVGRVHPRSVSRSEEHTSELQSLMRISYAVFCLKKKNNKY